MGIDILTEVIMLHLKNIPVQIYGKFNLVQYACIIVKLTVSYC